MARTINIPSTDYPVGVITQEIGQFGNVDFLRVTYTREPGGAWPGENADDAMVLTIEWDVGGGVSTKLPGGTVIGKDGNVLLQDTFTVTVPRVANGSGGAVKRPVSKGTITADIRLPLRTAFTIEAA